MEDAKTSEGLRNLNSSKHTKDTWFMNNDPYSQRNETRSGAEFVGSITTLATSTKKI